MRPPDRSILAVDVAVAVAQATVDPTLEGRALQDALRRAIANRRGSCSWDLAMTLPSSGVPQLS
jgi:hypothetical protein